MGQCSTSLINYVTFFQNIIEQVFLTNQKLKMNMLQILKTKYVVNFKKYRSRKKVQNWWSKNGKIK